MAKAKKRAAARPKSSKRGKSSAKSARKKTAKRAMPKRAKPKARRPGKSVTKPVVEATIAAALERPASGVAGHANAPMPAEHVDTGPALVDRPEQKVA